MGIISSRQDGKEESVVSGAMTLSVNPENPCPNLDAKDLPNWWTQRFLSDKERKDYYKGNINSLLKYTIKKNIERSKKEEISSEWKPIIKIIRHKTTKDITKVDSKFGQTVCTTDHSLMQWNGTRLEKVGPYGLNKPCSVSVPIETPEDSQYIFNIKGETGKNGIIELKNHGKGSYHFCPTLSYDTERAEATCRFLGVFVAEGSTTQSETSGQASITVYDKPFIEQISRDATSFLGKDFKIHEYRARKKTEIRGRTVFRRKMKYYRVSFGEVSLRKMLRELCGVGCKNKKVPSFLFTAPLHLKQAFLNGLFRGDAYTFDTKNKNEEKLTQWYKDNAFRFSTSSLRLASGVCFLLASMGIRFSVSNYNGDMYKIDFVAHRKNCSGNKPAITNLGKTDEYVYDVEIKDYHTFVDAMGLLVVHNSDDYWLPHHLATAMQEFKKYPHLYMVSNFWGLAKFTVCPDGRILNEYVVPPHHKNIVNTNCRVHRKECLSVVSSFNTSCWGEDQDFFGRIEGKYPQSKTGIVTSINGYIRGGNNLTYQFDPGIKQRYYQ
jgi:intein/homing endonuclease